MLTDEQMRERMAKGWRGGKPFTVCGNGTLPTNTQNIRSWLPGVIRRYGVLDVADVGAGDMKWKDGMTLGDVSYTPYDLVPRSDEVIAFDVTRDVLPPVDLIICRMVLNHLADDPDRIKAAIIAFQNSGARLLAATQFDSRGDRTREFQRVDLTAYLGDYLEHCQDGNEPNCKLALWEL